MLNQLIKKLLRESTSDSTGGRGSYIAPLQLGVRKFKNSENGPFTIPVSKYDSPMLEFDSYDGSMDETKKQIKKIESKSKKVTNYIILQSIQTQHLVMMMVILLTLHQEKNQK